MKARTLTTLNALLLIALTAVPAAAGGHRITTTPDATLYEVTENMRIDETTGVRTALAALQGTAKVGTPLCPAVFVEMFGGTSCTVTAIGADRIDLTRGTGTLWGDFAVVVNIELGNPVDAPELVVMFGTFVGQLHLQATVDGVLPIIAITDGQFMPDAVFGVPNAAFSGVFRLPFTVGQRGRFEKPRRNGPAFYLTDDGKKERVKNEEYSLGWPTVRVEVLFDTPPE